VPTAIADPTPSQIVDLVGERAARRLALDVGALVGRPDVLVLLAHPTTRQELARVSTGRVPPVDGSALLGLVLPTDPTVCDVLRLHEPNLRALARHWRAPRVLVAPCVLGTELVGLALAPADVAMARRPVEQAAIALVERFSARVVATRLVAAFRRDTCLVAG
jgi:hypothetical protein